MLEFNQWFFVLVVNFIILLLILNVIFFKPIAKIFKEREMVINSALDEAKAMSAKKEDAITEINTAILLAKNKAKRTFDTLIEEGIIRQKEILTKAEAEAIQIIEKAKIELQAETDRAKAALKTDIEGISSEIMNKLVKIG